MDQRETEMAFHRSEEETSQRQSVYSGDGWAQYEAVLPVQVARANRTELEFESHFVLLVPILILSRHARNAVGDLHQESSADTENRECRNQKSERERLGGDRDAHIIKKNLNREP